MPNVNKVSKVFLRVMALIAIVFGIVTIKSGGTVLFIDGDFRQQAGNYVPFIVWFNFVAGFFYIVAGVVLWKLSEWSIWLSSIIAVCTLVIYIVFGFYILEGNSYEERTVVAMMMRLFVWSAIAFVSYKILSNRNDIISD